MNKKSIILVVFLLALIQADYFLVTLQRFAIQNTLGDSGGTEEWKIKFGTLSPGEGTYHNGILGQTGDYSTSQNGKWAFDAACNPPVSSSNLNYHCYPRVNGNLAQFCVDSTEFYFNYKLNFQIGDYDGEIFDNGPTWIYEKNETVSSLTGSAFERYFTRTCPEGRQARMFMIHYRYPGSCASAGYTKKGAKGFDHYGDWGGKSGIIRAGISSANMLTNTVQEIYSVFTMGLGTFNLQDFHIDAYRVTPKYNDVIFVGTAALDSLNDIAESAYCYLDINSGCHFYLHSSNTSEHLSFCVNSNVKKYDEFGTLRFDEFLVRTNLNDLPTPYDRLYHGITRMTAYDYHAMDNTDCEAIKDKYGIPEEYFYTALCTGIGSNIDCPYIVSKKADQLSWWG